MLRNTHRHPVNRALHFAGMPFYVLGIAHVVGFFAGYPAEPALGAMLLLAGISMFTLGHRIEGNLGSITPVLASRLISRNVRRYLAANIIHDRAP
jgi:uncharacterized membrane protein (Fun14 family)